MEIKNKNRLLKTLYSPIEAAIRWSDLFDYEYEILNTITNNIIKEDDFPQWPLLFLNYERILDALINDELPYSLNTMPQRCCKKCFKQQQCPVHNPKIKIRHVHLKYWMQTLYPSEKPPFLFDDIEQRLHSAINVDIVQSIMIERDLLKEQYQKSLDTIYHQNLELERLQQSKPVAGEGTTRGDPGLRKETTYLNIIGGLLHLMLSQSPGGKRYSLFTSQAAIISALLAHHQGVPGISERTLWAKLAEARKSLANRQ